MLALTKQPVLEVIMAESIVPTVKPCVKCGGLNKYARGECKDCSRITRAKYRAENREEIRRKNAEYRKNNPEKVEASRAGWIEKNPEMAKTASKRWRDRNPEAMQKCRDNWAKANPDRVKEIGREWKRNNPEAVTRYNHNRRDAKINSGGGKLSRGIIKKLIKLQKGLCPCCFMPLGDDYHLDHIMPLALGGTNTDDNVQLLRSICNLNKSQKHPVDFMQERGFLL